MNAQTVLPIAGPVGFLAAPPDSEAADRLYHRDHTERGYVMNASRLWSHVPSAHHSLFELLAQMAEVAGITHRERAVLITACASAMGDSYCSLAWGRRLADATSPELAATVVGGGETDLDLREAAVARWARRVATDPNATTASDVDELRQVGFSDGQVFALTLFVAGRIAFSTVNDALGATPDAGLLASTPAPLRDAVTFGRQP